MHLSALKKYKFLTAILGVLVTGLPVYLFTSWLQQQGEAEVSIVANWSVSEADLAIDRTVATLGDLANKNVDACTPGNVEILRQTVFASGLVKELGLAGPNGETLCTDAGTSFAPREILASAATSNPHVMLDVLRTTDRDVRYLRVRRLGGPHKPAITALLPAGLLLPQLSPDGSPLAGVARITLADGTLVGTSGGTQDGDRPRLLSRARSTRYGPVVTVALERSGVVAGYDDLRRIGMVVSGMFALAILVGALFVPWRERDTPISEIEKALIANEFIPYYQPIINIKTGKLLGAEVLVRWRKPDGTIVSPNSFIPLLESSGLILDLTRSLMRQVCSEVGQAIGGRPNMYVTFNIAPLHFIDSVVLNDVGSIFEGSPIRLSQVVLELTERYEITNLSATRRVVAALQGLGCRIALDDVGTGHSGLSYILKLGIDIIKIDKLFVEAIKTDKQSQAIVETLVSLANNLRMQIVAEGVESFEQVVYLREHGISAAQGYLFAPPLPGSAFLDLVEAIDPRVTAAAGQKPAAPKQIDMKAFDRYAA